MNHMARKIIENVNEDMLKDMMMSDIPLYGRKAFIDEAKEVKGQPGTQESELLETENKGKPTDSDKGIPGSRHRKKKEFPISDYRSRFLINTQASNRSHVYINREVMDCIRQYLPVIAPGVSISGYLSNIFVDHIQRHWDEINEMYKTESVKPLKQV